MAFDWKRYVLMNGIWLTFPALIWHVIFASRLPAQFLPEIFWKDIPVVVHYGENILRTFAFAIPAFFMLASPRAGRQGWSWYIAGTLVYFVTWLPLLFAPGSAWSTSMLGFMAPAYTPLIWLVGIGLLGTEFYFPLRYRPVYYIAPAVLFTIFHCTHAAIVYLRNF
jgi:hypothetical protein